MNSSTFLIFKTVLVLSLLSFSVKAQTDSSERYKVNSITISGNKKTKDKILIRELIKQTGDTLTLRNINRIARRGEFNIFNTYLFIYDSINYKVNDTLKTIDYSIKVKERWYIWPTPFVDFLDRNLNAWLQTKDLDRLNYGMALSFDNFTGVKDRLILQVKTGYANQFGFNYRLPYLNQKQTLGAYVQYLYTESNKLHYRTLNNTQLFTASDSEHLRTEHGAKIGIFYRPKLFLQHSLDIYYNSILISDRINLLNQKYFHNNSNTTAYTGIQYRLTYDDRDNKIYPLQGTMIDLNFIKDGFDISDNSKLNTAQGYFTLKNYFPIGKRFNFANQLKARYVNAEQLPFAFNQALGYSNYIRGYEYNVIDGQNYFLLKNSFRFQLIKPKYHEIGMLKKLKPFSTIPFYAYINVFYDGAYVQEKFYKQTNTLANSWQHGYGIGLDLITYYDMVFRLEYSLNKQNQGGFYIHLTSGF
ncbi:MAG: BamA/TamA family outer membrane protein [Bacteroidia bacterium]|nr:BamA/TamA family outer membrane protein [Bacteroidia bacterium]